MNEVNSEHRQKRWLKHVVPLVLLPETQIPDWGWKELLVLEGSSTHLGGLAPELKSLSMDGHILHHILTRFCKHKVSLKEKLESSS